MARDITPRSAATIRPTTRHANFRHALDRVCRYAQHDDVILLIEGETGTGKNRLARYLHSISPRAAAPFREFSLGAADDALASSELFGHLEGAFTDARRNRAGHFQSAHGGTLLLDEIGKASRRVQTKLLQVVETGEFWPIGSDRAVRVDVRLITASNVALQSLVESERFLPDLFARIGMFRITLPPLRERPEDIPALTKTFIDLHARKYGYNGNLPIVGESLMCAFQAAPWPYNIRQLELTIRRLMIDSACSPLLTLDHCVDDLSYLRREAKIARVALTVERAAQVVDEAGSKTAAAKSLGIHRSTLYRVLEKHSPIERIWEIAP